MWEDIAGREMSNWLNKLINRVHSSQKDSGVFGLVMLHDV